MSLFCQIPDVLRMLARQINHAVWRKEETKRLRLTHSIPEGFRPALFGLLAAICSLSDSW